MRHYYNVTDFRSYTLDVSDIHENAIYRLSQLLDAGIKEEAILSHLINKPFGQFNPDSYLNALPTH
jgi:hypothetical protein